MVLTGSPTMPSTTTFVPHSGCEQWRPLGEGRLRVSDRRQRLVADRRTSLGRVLGRGTGRCDDDPERLAHEAGDLRRHRVRGLPLTGQHPDAGDGIRECRNLARPEHEHHIVATRASVVSKRSIRACGRSLRRMWAWIIPGRRRSSTNDAGTGQEPGMPPFEGTRAPGHAASSQIRTRPRAPRRAVRVPGAAAEVPVEHTPDDLVQRPAGSCLADDRHQDARRAEPALERVVAAERLLQRVERAVRPQPLDGRRPRVRRAWTASIRHARAACRRRGRCRRHRRRARSRRGCRSARASCRRKSRQQGPRLGLGRARDAVNRHLD